MPTYGEIQKFVQRHHGFVPQTAWISCQGCVGSIDTPGGKPRWAGGVVASSHARTTGVRPSNRLFGISV